MSPTLFDGEWLVSSGNAYAFHWPFLGTSMTSIRIPDRGDVITFYHDSPTSHKPALLIKRVVGLPGDTIVQSRGAFQVNGRPMEVIEDSSNRFISEGHFVRFESLTRAFPRSSRWVVGADEVFVMGDHWDDSWDSRTWGPIPVSRIATKVLSRGYAP